MPEAARGFDIDFDRFGMDYQDFNSPEPSTARRSAPEIRNARPLLSGSPARYIREAIAG